MPRLFHDPDIRALTEAMELPECGCATIYLDCECEGPCDCPIQIGPPCEHMLARDHNLSIAEWAELLEAIDPEHYSDPPPPAGPACALSRQARVAVYEQRHAAGLHLYHPGDLCRHETDVGAAPLAERGRNGAVVRCQRIVTRAA